jgi:hypothetical protein
MRGPIRVHMAFDGLCGVGSNCVSDKSLHKNSRTTGVHFCFAATAAVYVTLADFQPARPGWWCLILFVSLRVVSVGNMAV